MVRNTKACAIAAGFKDTLPFRCGVDVDSSERDFACYNGGVGSIVRLVG
jgi:hypothetical protein